MNPQDHLCANLKSRNMAVCVCVVLERTLEFFSYWPPNKNLIILLLSFYRFLYLAFNNILYFSAFVCSFEFLIITFSFSFSSVLSVIMFRCSLFVNLSFSSALYIFLFYCLHLCYFLYYMFIYLFIYFLGGTGKQRKMHSNIQPFTHFSA
jgi:hypothetical protein